LVAIKYNLLAFFRQWSGILLINDSSFAARSDALASERAGVRGLPAFILSMDSIIDRFGSDVVVSYN